MRAQSLWIFISIALPLAACGDGHGGHDLTPPADLATPQVDAPPSPDLAAPRDLAAAIDLARPPDLAAPRDLAVPPDLALRPDLAMGPDLIAVNAPKCEFIGTRSEGWYQAGRRVCWTFCAGAVAECLFPGSKSEGWYASIDGKGCNGVKLIEWADCQ